MNLRQRKKNQKHANWVVITFYEAMGGDYSYWIARGDPVFGIVCSNCHEYAPMVKGKEESLDVMEYSILKKKCPSCGCRMHGMTWSE